jgi:hypothetical protein
MDKTFTIMGVEIKLAPGLEKFSDVFKTWTAKLVILVIFLEGFPTLVYPNLPPDMQAQVPAWALTACKWLAVAAAAGIIPARASKQEKN